MAKKSLAQRPLPPFKKCTRCGQEKPGSCFYVHERSKGSRAGRREYIPRCKECVAEVAQEKYRASHPVLGGKGHGHPYSGLPSEKRCCMCGETKPAASFNQRTVDGNLYLSAKCRSCSKEYARQRRAEERTAELQRAAGRRWKDKHANDPVAIAKRLVSRRKDYEKNGKRRRRERYWSNPEFRASDLAHSKNWRLQNKNKVAHRARTRARAAKDRYAETASIDEIAAAYAACLQSYRIGEQYWDVYESCLIENPTIDHVVPLKAGGTNDEQNLCVTSRSNNSSKRTTPLIVWMAQRARKLRGA